MIRTTLRQPAVMLPAMFLLGALLVPASAADPPRRLSDDPRVTDAVKVWEEWVEFQAAIDGVPGISTGIVHDQELLGLNAFGTSSTDTLYSICSISKLFTSVGVMQLREKGCLRLDDPVSEHLPWFDIRDVHPDDEPITVRGLLTHSSGLPRESDFPYWTAGDYPFPTREQIMDRLADQETLYPASRYFQYSNLGLALAGEIIAAHSGKDFGDYIRENILDPLGMKNTFTEVPRELRGGRLAVGHTVRQRDGSRKEVAPFETRGIAPAAGFASNVEDLARFAMWQNRLLSGGEVELLRPATLREMQRVQWVDPDWKTTWGLGFAVSREGERTYVTHGGGCPGYYTHFRLEPKSRIAAIVLSNSIGTDTGFYTQRAIEIVGPAVEKALEDPEGAPVRDGALERYTGIYDSIWGQWAIVHWEDGLGALWLTSRNPGEHLIPLKKSGEHAFRRVRKDGDVPGEAFVFQVDGKGTVTSFTRHSGIYPKVR